MMHEAIEDRRSHGIMPQVCAPILHDAIGGDDDAAAQFVALMDHGLQQGAGRGIAPAFGYSAPHPIAEGDFNPHDSCAAQRTLFVVLRPLIPEVCFYSEPTRFIRSAIHSSTKETIDKGDKIAATELVAHKARALRRLNINILVPDDKAALDVDGPACDQIE